MQKVQKGQRMFNQSPFQILRGGLASACNKKFISAYITTRLMAGVVVLFRGT